MIEFLFGAFIGNLLSSKRSKGERVHSRLPYWTEKHFIEQAKKNQIAQANLQAELNKLKAEPR